MIDAICMILLPPLIGFLGYGNSYGYRGDSKEVAKRKMRYAWAGAILFICYPYMILRLVILQW